MPSRSLKSSLAICLAAVGLLLTSCTSSKDLTRSKVLALVKDQKEEVKAMFKSAAMVLFDARYKKLVEAGIMTCTVNDLVCKRGPNGQELQENHPYMVFVLGYRTPTEVTGISKRDETHAEADVKMTFELTSEFYKKHKAILDPVLESAQLGRVNMETLTTKVRLKLYDDGWRIEKSLF